VFGALINGAIFPLYAVVLSEMLEVLFRPDNDELLNGASMSAI